MLLLAGLLALAIPAGGIAAPSPSATAPGPGLSLTAAPLNGSVPLDVAFRAALTPSSLSATFHWSFGDGLGFQEVATSYSAVDHAYSEAGYFTAQVVVTSAQGDQNASVTVRVLPASLADSIRAVPLEGSAPLTVHFVAQPSGGTGTYPTILWQFGDGDNGSGPDLQYTYLRPGSYTVTLEVADSSGAWANTSQVLHVADSSTPSGGSGVGLAPLLPWVLPIGGTLGAIAGGLVAYRSLLGRRAPIGAPPAAPKAPTSPAPAPRSMGPPTPEAMEGALPRTGRLEESRRLSERILVHLYWHGKPGAYDVASVESSQAGMARRFGVTQNAVSKALNRLVDSGTVVVSLRHVPGASRRLKTYALSPRGETVARSLRADEEPGANR